MAAKKGSYRYWTKEKRKLFKTLYTQERGNEKLIKAFPNKTWMSFRLLASEMGIGRFSNIKKLPTIERLKITDNEASWLAGFIDGEGCISLYPTYKEKDKGRLVPRISITHTNKEILDYVKELTGCSHIKSWEMKKIPKGWKKSYHFQTNNISYIRKFLIAILPFLKLKKKHGKLLLEFIEIRLLSPRKRKPREQEIYEELKILNKKG